MSTSRPITSLALETGEGTVAPSIITSPPIGTSATIMTEIGDLDTETTRTTMVMITSTRTVPLDPSETTAVSNPQSTPVDPSSGNEEVTSDAWIAGAVVGPIMVVAILGAVIYWYIRRRRKNSQKDAASHTTSTQGPVSMIYSPLSAYTQVPHGTAIKSQMYEPRDPGSHSGLIKDSKPADIDPRPMMYSRPATQTQDSPLVPADTKNRKGEVSAWLHTSKGPWGILIAPLNIAVQSLRGLNPNSGRQRDRQI
jgi:hypothetical protein